MWNVIDGCETVRTPFIQWKQRDRLQSPDQSIVSIILSTSTSCLTAGNIKIETFKTNIKIKLLCRTYETRHTPPEWAYKQKSWPEKWDTTYCQGPLGLPKNAFGQIWELSFEEKITFFWFVRKCQTKPCSWWNIWTLGGILTYLKKKLLKSVH